MSEPQDDKKAAKKGSPRPPGETLKPTDTGVGGGAHSSPPTQIGRFVVKRVLGKGAFGTVYLAADPTTSRDVAIKLPHDGLTPALKARFLRETRATTAVSHPNVCPVYEVGTHGEVPYLVMQYVEGTTLAGYLDSHSLPPLQAVVIARRLADGVAAAHAKGVVHRDLKPQNVLFDPDRFQPVVTDFGLAMLANESRMTADGSVFGTPAYMSPEQARGKVSEIGPAADVYALGVILYHMLTGEVPFQGPVFAVLAQHAQAPSPRPSAVRAGIDPRLDAIVLKAMAKKPADRYPTAAEFVAALDAFASAASRPASAASRPGSRTTVRSVANPPRPAQRPPAAVPDSAPEPLDLPPEPRGSRTWLAVGGVLLVLTFVAGVFAPRLVGRLSGDRQPAVAKSDPPAVVTPAPAPKVTPEPKSKEPEPKPKEPEPKPKEPEPKPKEPEPKPKGPEVNNKLVGKWERLAPLSKGGTHYMHFAGDGTMKMYFDLPDTNSYAYALNANKLTIDVGGKDVTYAVLKLTDDVLQMSTGGTFYSFQKVKSKEPEPKPPEPKTDGQTLVGKWVLKEKGLTVTVEFMKGGTMLLTTNADKPFSLEGSYTLKGDKLTMEMKLAKGSTNTIVKLTADELELKSESGMTTSFKRVKP